MTFTFQPINAASMDIYRSWFAGATTRRRISYPDDVWAAYVLHTPNVYAWSVETTEDCIAILQADVEKKVAYFVVTINPAWRGKGYCKKVIADFIQLPEMQCIEVFEAQIEKDNTVSLQCHTAAGFILTGEDDAFFLLQRRSTATV